jgi:hypothetical protein
VLTTRDGNRLGDLSFNHTHSIRRAFEALAVVAVAATLTLTSGIGAAMAAPGDQSHASGQYLSGNLFTGTLSNAVDLSGESLDNSGSQPSDTERNDLNLALLGAVTVTSPGGLQIPLSLGNAGVLSQYAQVNPDGSSTGATGLVASDGSVGTGAVPPAQVPGPLSFDLHSAVAGAGLDTALTDEVANLSLGIGATSSRASHAPPAATVRSYEMAGANLTFQSKALGSLVTNLNSAIAPLQTTVNGLGATLDANFTPVANLTVTTPNLANSVSSLLTGTIGDLATDGVTINLATGTVTVDIDHFAPLNGLAPNTPILTPTEVGAITGAITGLVNSLVTTVGTTLQTTLNGITIDGTVLLGLVTINTSVGHLLAGAPAGDFTIIGGAISLSGLLALLAPAVATLGGTVTSLVTTVATPAVSAITAGLAPVIAAVVQLTANAQGSAGGIDSVTALRIDLLPGLGLATTADLATSTVGPNAFVALPTITSLAPNTGPDSGGTVVTITGTGLDTATSVTIGGTVVTPTAATATSLTFTTPPHAAGGVNVVVNAPQGDSDPLPFTYVPSATTLSGLTPPSGPETGGTLVTITGSGLTDATGATFAGVPGTGFTVVSDTEATVVTPAHVPGSVPVVVSNPNGAGTGLSYLYVAAPSVATSLAPTAGPESGGTTITITGSGFTGATGVTIDGLPATGFTVVNDTTITAVTPPHTAGAVSVVVSDPDGDSPPLTFTYTAQAATVSSLSPTSGPIAGGTLVTITGAGLIGATSATFDGIPGTGFTVVSPTSITVISPPHAVGGAPVVVHDPTGDSAPQTFTYFDSPATISGLTPTSGPDIGGTSVTITGTGLLSSSGATFGGVPGTDYTVVNDTTVTVTTPAHVPATVPVVVQDGAGNGTGLTFEFINEPSDATSLTPPSGTVLGGTTVTITGTGFTGASGVTFDATAGTAFAVVSDTEITVVTPAHALGAVDVIVTDGGGDSAPLAYDYTAAPSDATSIAPATGPETGGTAVVIQGSGFTGATGVTFDSVPGTAFTVINDTTIHVTSPAGTVGPVDVVVTDPAGDSDPLTFTYTPVTTIDTVAPPLGPEAGGTTVVITGTCFTGATAVMFGTVTVTTFTVNPAGTQITVVAPAGSGTVDVSVVGGGTCGTATDPGAYTYTAAASVADSMTPTSGTESGGTHVTITGSGFTGATGVTFDGTPGTAFTVVDDTTITVVTPPHAPGTVDVVVLDPATNATPLSFDYTPAANGTPSDPGGSGAGLATTGFDVAGGFGAALLLLLAGAAILISRMRRVRH